MDDCCVVCTEPLEWVAYGPCLHREVCSTCVARLRFICDDRRCCICKTNCNLIFVTKIHFRQQHFLCEDDACLAKKFIVFQSELEMKRHNTMEHGGRMSRSKRGMLLLVCDVAVEHMMEILACSHQSKTTQELFLSDFLQVVEVTNTKEALWHSLEEDMIPSFTAAKTNWLELQSKLISKKHTLSNVCVAGGLHTVKRS